MGLAGALRALLPPGGAGQGTLDAGVVLFLLGPGVLAALATGSVAAGAALGLLLLAGTTAALQLGPPGTLLALDQAGAPATLVALLLVLSARLLRRLWPEHAPATALGLALPMAGPALVLAVLCHPALATPGLDTQARLLGAIRADPLVALVPGEAPPGLAPSPVLAMLAWPLAPVLGDRVALGAAAALALGLSLLLVFALARLASAPEGAAPLAQVLLLILPPLAWRPVAPEAPLGQCLALFLLVHLGRRLGHLVGARDTAVACVFVCAAELVGPADALGVTGLMAALAALEILAGERSRARRLATAWAVGSLPVATLLWAGVLPGAGWLRGAVATMELAVPPVLGPGAERLALGYGPAAALLVAVGLAAPPGSGRATSRPVLGAALAAGLALTFLGDGFPPFLRGAGSAQLAPAVAALSAPALAGLGRGGWKGRLLAAAVVTALFAQAALAIAFG